MSAPSFSKDTPNKISDRVNVSGEKTLIKTQGLFWRAAIAEEPIDAKVDGKKFFCVRVENPGPNSMMMIGFTPVETFDSRKEAWFGYNGFTGAGIDLCTGDLYYPVNKRHNIIDGEISKEAKEIIVILTISNNGKKKEIRFLCDGKESKSSDVSEILNGDFLYPAISLFEKHQQITTIPIDQIEKRTTEINLLVFEYQAPQQKNELAKLFFLQREMLFREMKEKMNLGKNKQ
jgi:hypothetical protein